MDDATIEKVYRMLTSRCFEEFQDDLINHIEAEEDCMTEFEIKCNLKEMLS